MTVRNETAEEHKILHFTIGPVQGFVEEARRLRDFWAGSFLLSWLSGRAMKALADHGGTVVFPDVAGDPLFQAIGAGGEGLKVGTLPNRFKAEIGAVTGDAGAICADAVQQAWAELADTVWKRFLAPVADKGLNTREIWDRQIGQFWEIAWVTGPAGGDGGDSDWLDRRKNWRSHWPPQQEQSDLCMMMGHLQEVSGYRRFGDAQKQKAFWAALRGQQKVGPLNLRDDERLSAVALVKRLFPLLETEDQKEVLGFTLAREVRNWPSTAYVAAVPWLKRLADAQDDDVIAARRGYEKTARENLSSGYRGEAATEAFGLPRKPFFDFDGPLYYEDGIAALSDEAFRSDGDAGRATLQKSLERLYGACGLRPSKFYALLVMDGDRIGSLLRDDPDAVKAGLAAFAEKVKGHFDPPNPDNGVLIYAGGDDVLAMLPVDGAIAAAHTLRGLYDEAFAGAGIAGSGADFTMSAAIVFAHYKVPLRHVIRKGHEYLEDVAKDRNGRDSLALAAMKPGGIVCDWVSCWQDAERTKPARVLEELAMGMRSDPEFAGGFFHALQERYAALFYTPRPNRAEAFAGGADDERDTPEQFGDPELMRALIRYEYLHSGKARGEEADRVTEKLMRVGRPLKRHERKVTQGEEFCFDAGLMVRFLSRNGLWEGA